MVRSFPREKDKEDGKNQHPFSRGEKAIHTAEIQQLNQQPNRKPKYNEQTNINLLSRHQRRSWSP